MEGFQLFQWFINRMLRKYKYQLFNPSQFFLSWGTGIILCSVLPSMILHLSIPGIYTAPITEVVKAQLNLSSHDLSVYLNLCIFCKEEGYLASSWDQ